MNLWGVGVALSKDDTYKKFTRLTGAMAFSLMGRTKGKRALRDGIAEKMAEKIHVSNSVAISMFPYLEIMFENDDVAYDISTFFDFDEDEIKRFRKRKIPKSVIKRKEKERQEELDKRKEKQNQDDLAKEKNIKLNNNSLNQEESLFTSNLEPNIKNKESNLKLETEKTKENKEELNSSKKDRINKNKSKKEEETTKTDDDKENNIKKDKEIKKDSAQKSLFNF
nr:hypothetical protein [Methanobrevibacter arboriphilus]